MIDLSLNILMLCLLVQFARGTNAPYWKQAKNLPVDEENVFQTWFLWKIAYHKGYNTQKAHDKFDVFARNYEKVRIIKLLQQQ